MSHLSKVETEMNWRENCKKATHGIFPLDQYLWVFTCFELVIYVLSKNTHIEEIDIVIYISTDIWDMELSFYQQSAQVKEYLLDWLYKWLQHCV